LGDSNSRFFHGIVNGRKCNIFALEIEEGEISEPSELRKHIDEYYKKLFGREERGQIRLRDDICDGQNPLKRGRKQA
jgi:hypothetical protein